MSTQQIWYYEPERDITDTIREWGCDLCITALAYIDLLSRWEWLDELRWKLEEIPSHLFGLWYENTPQSLKSVIDGEIPLHAVGDWERAHIVGFHLLEWRCVEPGCHCECQTHEAENGHCLNASMGAFSLKFNPTHPHHERPHDRARQSRCCQ